MDREVPTDLQCLMSEGKVLHSIYDVNNSAEEETSRLSTLLSKVKRVKLITQILLLRRRSSISITEEGGSECSTSDGQPQQTSTPFSNGPPLVVDHRHSTYQILLGRKAQGFGKDKWMAFGGKVDKEDASFEEGAARELQEECGLSIPPEKLLKVAIFWHHCPPAMGPDTLLEFHTYVAWAEDAAVLGSSVIAVSDPHSSTSNGEQHQRAKTETPALVNQDSEMAQLLWFDIITSPISSSPTTEAVVSSEDGQGGGNFIEDQEGESQRSRPTLPMDQMWEDDRYWLDRLLRTVVVCHDQGKNHLASRTPGSDRLLLLRALCLYGEKKEDQDTLQHMVASWNE